MFMSSSRICRVGAVILVALGLHLAVPSDAAEAPVIQMGTKASEVMVMKIAVSDLRRSLDFYTQVVGLKEFTLPGIARPNIEDGSKVGNLYLNYSGSPADPFLSLMRMKDVTPTAESAKVAWICFKVADARAVLNRAEAAGAPIIMDATKFLGVVAGLIRDPDGYTVELTQAETAKAAGAMAPDGQPE
ncbi:VOC family protein [Steroidobacter flavus]|uniref:VOC family protein n=1 Tax=Steroidobacter flavus TaxID=1842136 RepID=A0ABV8T1P3_9GAMM